MAALLTAMSIMAIALAAALPAWQQMMQREKEEELVFRGEQYSHAIALFQRKFANSAPPNIDVLVEQRFLRKKYKDPITNDDFVPIAIAPQTGGSAAQAGTQAGRAATPASSPSDRRRDSSRHRRGDRRRHQQERRSVDSLVQRAHASQRAGLGIDRSHAACRHGGARRVRNRALMMVMERSRGGGLH
jgi:type II secretory pathway pseudopilin PulG